MTLVSDSEAEALHSAIVRKEAWTLDSVRRLRADAERRLGPRFSLPEFHDALLGGGAVSLPVLREQIDAWVKSRESVPATSAAR